MRNIKKIILLQLFNEDIDEFRGPSWAIKAFVAVSILNYVAIGSFVLALIKNSDTWVWQALALMAGSFALLCGLAWNYGLRGRAKNGLLLAIALTVVALVYKSAIGQ